jgi:site-specific DNA-cytosine methylase
VESAENNFEHGSHDKDGNRAEDGAPRLDLSGAVPPIDLTGEGVVKGGLGEGEDAGQDVGDLGDDRQREIEALYGRELGKVKDTVSRWRAMQVKEAFRIGDMWSKLIERLSADEVSAFLASECQIPRRDVARYARLAETSQTHKALFIEKGVAVSVLLDLVAQPKDVRDEAIRMVEAGRCLQARELKALKRDIGLARGAKEGTLDKSRMRDLKNAAARMARNAASSWLASLETLTNEVIALSHLDHLKSVSDFEMERVSKLTEEASALLEQLPTVAGADFVARAKPAATGLGYDSWTRVEATLRRIAAGDVFEEVWYEKPLTRVLEFDQELVWPLAWVFGYDDDRDAEAAASRMRKAGKAPLDTSAKAGRVWSDVVKKPSVLEICAGGGGQALGLEAAGFHHAGLVEIDPDAAATLRANGSNWPVIEADLRGLDLAAYEGVDLLAGGVPCQPYSPAGERLGAYDERDLFPEALRLIRELKPKAVLLENVTGALHAANSVNRLRILSELARLGYDAEWRILEGPDFGLPQKRRRAILVGFQPGIMHRFRWPSPLPTPAPTVGEALRDLMGAQSWPHVEAWVKAASGYAPTLIGGSQKKKGIDLAQENSRESWTKIGVNPSGRAKAAPGPDAPADHQPKLTLAMMARIQDFPDEWKFQGSDLQAFRQIANAFPPCMAQAVGASIMRALTGSEIDLPTALKIPRRKKPGGLNFDAVRSSPSTEDVDEMA